MPRARGAQLVQDTVFERIKSDIIEDRLSLGQKISEAQLAEVYDIGKAPIRAAIQKLTAAGLLLTKPQSGTYVFHLTLRELRALCELRAALEIEAVTLALLRAPDELAEKSADILAKMEDAHKAANRAQYLDLDTQLHALFFELSDSDLLLEIYLERVSSKFEALRTRFGRQDDHQENSIREHRKLVEAIRIADVHELTQLLRIHVANTQSYYARLLQ